VSVVAVLLVNGTKQSLTDMVMREKFDDYVYKVQTYGDGLQKGPTTSLIAGRQDTVVTNGDLVVSGESKFGEYTWLPHADGSSRIGPGKKGKDVIIGGEDTTKAIDMQVNSADGSYIRIGPQSWFPYTDKSTYIRPGKEGGDVHLGDWWTKNVNIGRGDGSTTTFLRGNSIADNPQVRGDIRFTGGNNWILHTPDDGRRTLYIAPSGNYGQENWNWGSQVRIEADGAMHTNRLCAGGVCIDGNDIRQIRNRSGL
jgi:hypothetical protein